MTLTSKQKGVLKGIIPGVGITVIVVFAAIFVNPLKLSTDISMVERIAFVIKIDLILLIWLTLSIARLARHRFFSADDIDGGGLTPGTEKANILQSTLQNTLEQTVLAIFVHLVWAVMIPANWLSTIPAAMILFMCGRIMFLRGYGQGAPARAPGFALTFYPSVLLLLIIVLVYVLRLFL
jgi:hypothetical protein